MNEAVNETADTGKYRLFFIVQYFKRGLNISFSQRGRYSK
ncbi:hypothetical protein HMPREF3156_02557 [Neisseria sp. HMSC06F02]|nr:hypothetical protein HMPREF3156_02557 [Neisseria sp. HMSC06F02]